MTTAGLVIGALTLAVAIVAAIFGYPAWKEIRRKPALRLVVRRDSADPDAPGLTVVDNPPGSDQRQIVFRLTLVNEGNREARNWRIRFASRDLQTMVYLGTDERRNFRRESHDGARWFTESLAASAADTITHGTPLVLGSRHTLNFSGNPATVVVDYSLDAERMETVNGSVRFEIDWDARVVRPSVHRR